MTGCRKNSSKAEDFDSVVYVLSEAMKNPIFPLDAKKRAESALSKWKNGTMDREPVLIFACVTQAYGTEEIDLALEIYDEDEDVLGFVIREEYTKTKVSIEESYPVYTHCTSFDVADLHRVVVQIRDENQRKDETQWGKYTSTSLEELVKAHIENDQFSANSLRSGQFWEETLPPVWVSIPEPNKADVWIYIYDKAGHKSEPVKLFNWLDDQ
jgi:hypothetical protein